MKERQYEVYRLTLSHWYVHEDGRRTQLEQPYILEHSIERTHSEPIPFIINTMMDRFKYELLKLKDDNYLPPFNWCGEEPIVSDPAPIKGFDMSKGVLDMQTGTFYPAGKDGEA